MRGADTFTESLFTMRHLDDFMPADHPLRVIRIMDSGHPDRIVHGQANEPAKQKVVLGLLHELALRAHAVEHLDEHGAQQLLGGNAGASALDVGRIHLGKQIVHLLQGLVDHDADHPQGVIKGHEVIEMAHREQALGEGVGSAHFWLVCLVGEVASIVAAELQLGSDSGEYFSSLLTDNFGELRVTFRIRRYKPLDSDIISLDPDIVITYKTREVF